MCLHINAWKKKTRRINYKPKIRQNAASLKRKCLHFDEIFITGCTGSCQNDNFQCSQWLKFRQNDDIFVSVFAVKWNAFEQSINWVLDALSGRKQLRLGLSGQCLCEVAWYLAMMTRLVLVKPFKAWSMIVVLIPVYDIIISSQTLIRLAQIGMHWITD